MKKIVTLGEIMLRLSTPGNKRFVQQTVSTLFSEVEKQMWQSAVPTMDTRSIL